MFERYLLLMLLGHVLADFYTQTSKMAEKKNKELKWVLLHCFMYLLTVIVVSVPVISIKILILDITISLCHALIDVGKYFYLSKREESAKVFILDQILHIMCIVVVAYIWTRNNVCLQEITFIEEFFDVANMSELLIGKWILGLLIVHKPTNIMIQKLIGSYKQKSDSNKIDMDNNIGRKIGTVERVLMLILLYLNQYSAIGLVLTAKSIARYDRIRNDEKFAEYYLLGTLLSVAISVVCAALLF